MKRAVENQQQESILSLCDKTRPLQFVSKVSHDRGLCK